MPGDHGGAGHAMRKRFTERFIKADRQSRVRFDPPRHVGDWARAITRGVDLLSDRDSYAITGVRGFKSVGAWGVGPCGVVHLENCNGPAFDHWVVGVDGEAQPREPLLRAVRGFRRHVREFAQIMAEGDDDGSAMGRETGSSQTHTCLRGYREALAYWADTSAVR